jgi:hypothetical protein
LNDQLNKLGNYAKLNYLMPIRGLLRDIYVKDLWALVLGFIALGAEFIAEFYIAEVS